MDAPQHRRTENRSERSSVCQDFSQPNFMELEHITYRDWATREILHGYREVYDDSFSQFVDLACEPCSVSEWRSGWHNSFEGTQPSWNSTHS